jgi:hypothetical protein
MERIWYILKSSFEIFAYEDQGPIRFRRIVCAGGRFEKSRSASANKPGAQIDGLATYKYQVNSGFDLYIYELCANADSYC